MKEKSNKGLENLVKNIRIFFVQNELKNYSGERNPKTGKIYAFEAKRKFTKYYIQHNDEFIQNVTRYGGEIKYHEKRHNM